MRLSRRVLSTDCQASRMLAEIALVLCKGRRFTNPRPGIVLACLRIRRVGTFRGFDFNASRGQLPNWDRSQWAWG